MDLLQTFLRQTKLQKLERQNLEQKIAMYNSFSSPSPDQLIDFYSDLKKDVAKLFFKYPVIEILKKIKLQVDKLKQMKQSRPRDFEKQKTIKAELQQILSRADQFAQSNHNILEAAKFQQLKVDLQKLQKLHDLNLKSYKDSLQAMLKKETESQAATRMLQPHYKGKPLFRPKWDTMKFLNLLHLKLWCMKTFI